MKPIVPVILITTFLASFLPALTDGREAEPENNDERARGVSDQLQDSKASEKGKEDRASKALTLKELTKELQDLKQRMEKSTLLLQYGWLLRSLRGKDGKDGRDGRDGVTGPQGPAGSKGGPGKNGIPGNNGVSGKDGARGPTGPKGVPGPRGQNGRDGPQGIRGPPGAQGEAGKQGGGVAYVRWGRTTCPGGAVLVYAGRMGGGYYSHGGGGADYVCLPNIPKYGKHKDGFQNGGYVSGVEYEVNDFNPFKKNLHDHDAPCAVCYVKSRGTQIMIPATYDCSAGWIREYHGYLMAAHRSHSHATSYVCVDEDAEYVPGSKNGHNGALLYPQQRYCGSLPCKPYVNSWQLTCAVCTK